MKFLIGYLCHHSFNMVSPWFHQKPGPDLRKCIAASLKILFWSLVLLMVIQCSAGMTISYMLSDFMVTDAGTPVASGGIRWHPVASGGP